MSHPQVLTLLSHHPAVSDATEREILRFQMAKTHWRKTSSQNISVVDSIKQIKKHIIDTLIYIRAYNMLMYWACIDWGWLSKMESWRASCERQTSESSSYVTFVTFFRWPTYTDVSIQWIKFGRNSTYESAVAFLPHLIKLNSTRQKCDVWTGP